MCHLRINGHEEWSYSKIFRDCHFKIGRLYLNILKGHVGQVLFALQKDYYTSIREPCLFYKTVYCTFNIICRAGNSFILLCFKLTLLLSIFILKLTKIKSICNGGIIWLPCVLLPEFEKWCKSHYVQIFHISIPNPNLRVYLHSIDKKQYWKTCSIHWQWSSIQKLSLSSENFWKLFCLQMAFMLNLL
jgi:hypothetical protein